MRALISVFDDDGTMVVENKLIDPSSIIRHSGDEGAYVTKYTFTFEARKIHCFTRKGDSNGTCEEKENSEE